MRESGGPAIPKNKSNNNTKSNTEIGRETDVLPLVCLTLSSLSVGGGGGGGVGGGGGGVVSLLRLPLLLPDVVAGWSWQTMTVKSS